MFGCFTLFTHGINISTPVTGVQKLSDKIHWHLHLEVRSLKASQMHLMSTLVSRFQREGPL